MIDEQVSHIRWSWPTIVVNEVVIIVGFDNFLTATQ